jgi:hypothetical protein
MGFGPDPGNLTKHYYAKPTSVAPVVVQRGRGRRSVSWRCDRLVRAGLAIGSVLLRSSESVPAARKKQSRCAAANGAGLRRNRRPLGHPRPAVF